VVRKGDVHSSRSTPTGWAAREHEQRVAERVAIGGHDVPEVTVRRRHRAGLRNFFELYRPLASTWRFYDASGQEPGLIARQVELAPVRVYDREAWDLIARQNRS
jgi:predicted ABC-type ATPase